MAERKVGRGRRRQGQSKVPGIVYSGTSAGLVLLIATLAITAAQSPPPAIAELAPQAVQQIKEAPTEQSSALGSAEGGSGLAGAPTTTTTPPPTVTTPDGAVVTTTTAPRIERARVRRCVGNPPRQTEDPQSPPCVPFWEGDNGGATYKGVTADTITMVLPYGGERIANLLMAYFNKRYEFYGRKLVIIPAEGGSTCQERKAAAVYADDELKVFAALDATNGNAGPCFQAEMARRKLMSVVYNPTFSESDMAELAPHLWQYDMSFDKILTGAGEMYCARMANQNAVRSPDPVIRLKPRKLGAIVQNVLRDTPLDTSPLDRALAKCGAEVARYERLSSNDDVGLTSPEKAQLAMARFKSEDITTIVNLGIAFLSQYISTAAENQGYYPEWIFTSYGGFDANLVIRAFWPQASQRQSIVGTSVTPVMRPWAMEPAYWAVREVDPAMDPVADVGPMGEFANQYRAMLVLASGIQMAGPNLTPQTFEAALQRTKFPYPAADETKSGDVGFANDHSMTDDFTEFWWSDAAKSPLGLNSDGGPGAICYLDNSARRRLGQWPTGNGAFFELPCGSNA